MIVENWDNSGFCLGECRFKDIFQSAEIGLALVGMEGRFLEVNPAMAESLGCDLATVLKTNLYEWISPKQRLSLKKRIEKIIRFNQKHFKITLKFQTRPKKITWAKVNFVLIRSPKDSPHYFLLEFYDISKEKLGQKRSGHFTSIDSLTHLLNQDALKTQVASKLEEIKLKQGNLFVFLVNIDRFSLINDAYGFEFGDLVIKAFVDRLKHFIGQKALFLRINGDDFMIIPPFYRQVEKADVFANDLLRHCEPPFLIQEKSISLTISIGLSLFPQHGKTVSTLLKQAHSALYRAKNSGGNRLEYANKSLQRKSEARLTQTEALHHAIQRQEIGLYYQPQMDLSTGKIIGFEALARWVKESEIIASPNHFISLAEESGLINKLGSQLLEELFKQVYSWQQQGLYWRTALNISPKQCKHEQLLAQIEDLLATYPLAPEWIEFELTESLTMENLPLALTLMNAFKKLGFTLALDDFGTGYSSLHYLTHFPFDILKIDSAFIQTLKPNTTSQDSQLVAAIIQMAKQLKLTTVAEGVETLEQLKILQVLGCDRIQGFYLSPAIPPAQIFDFMKKQSENSSFLP